MATENDKAIQILGKVIVKLQELVKELEAPPVAAPPEAQPAEKKFLGLFGGKHHTKGSKKSKKLKGGDIDMSTKSSMIYNTSDLTSGVSSVPPNVMNDGRVISLQYQPQPFSAGNTYGFSPSMKDTLDSQDVSSVTPSIYAGGAKRKTRKSAK